MMRIDPADLELPATRPVDLTLLNEELLERASVLSSGSGYGSNESKATA